MKEGKIPKIILCRCMREDSQVGLFLGFPIHILICVWKQQFCVKAVLFLLYSVVIKHGHLRTVNQVLEEHVCNQIVAALKSNHNQFLIGSLSGHIVGGILKPTASAFAML